LYKEAELKVKIVDGREAPYDPRIYIIMIYLSNT